MKIYGTWHAFMVEQLKEQEEVRGFLDSSVFVAQLLVCALWDTI